MKTSFFHNMIVTSTLLIAGFAGAAPPQRHAFGERLQGDVVEHEFALENESDTPIQIAGVELTPPLALARTPAQIPANGRAILKVKLDTARIQGDYQGQMHVQIAGGGERSFALEGKVVPPIEVVPLPAFFIATSKGIAKSASLEIVNREEKPLELHVPSDSLYPLKLETIEPGRRFRLTVDVPATANPGRQKQRLDLKTSSTRKPVLFVGLHSVVRDRVYTFPDTVDFGLVHLGGPGDAQTLMVYQSGGKGFQVKGRSDIPGLDIKAEPGPQGDRVQLTLSMAGAKPGPLSGKIVLSTNDPEFPELQVPVTGQVQ
jgi:hypothetical protein